MFVELENLGLTVPHELDIADTAPEAALTHGALPAKVDAGLVLGNATKQILTALAQPFVAGQWSRILAVRPSPFRDIPA